MKLAVPLVFVVVVVLMKSSGDNDMIINQNSQQNMEEIMFNLGARTSADTVMTKLGSIYKWSSI